MTVKLVEEMLGRKADVTYRSGWIDFQHWYQDDIEIQIYFRSATGELYKAILKTDDFRFELPSRSKVESRQRHR